MKSSDFVKNLARVGLLPEGVRYYLGATCLGFYEEIADQVEIISGSLSADVNYIEVAIDVVNPNLRAWLPLPSCIVRYKGEIYNYFIISKA